MSELETLKNELLEQVKKRDKFVTELESAIDQINREFDSVAIKLNRRIKMLESEAEKPVVKTVKKKPVDLTYIDPEDREHFLRLRKKTRV